jgi:hypothetical protein
LAGQIEIWKRLRTQDVPELNRKLKQTGLKEIDAERASSLVPAWREAEKVAGED